MADYFTLFSCILDVGSAENTAAAFGLRDQLEQELERDGEAAIGFDLAIETEPGPGRLWISGDEYGDPEHVIQFVLKCAEAFDLKGNWGFCWAYTCSKPCLDGFGGGAQIINLTNRTSEDWVDLVEWVLLRDVDHVTDPETGEATALSQAKTAEITP